MKAESAVNKVGLLDGDASPASIKALGTTETQGVKRRLDTEFVAGSDSGVGALSDTTSRGKEDSSGCGLATSGRKEEGGESGVGTLSYASSERKKDGGHGVSGIKEALSSAPSTTGLQEQGHKQLRLLNEKLAKRHSKLPRREVTTRHSKFSPGGETTLSAGDSVQSRSEHFKFPPGGEITLQSRSENFKFSPGETSTLSTGDSASPSGGGNVTKVARQSGDGSLELAQRNSRVRQEQDSPLPSSDLKKTARMEPMASQNLPGKSVALKSRPLTEPAIPKALQPMPTAGPLTTGAFAIEDPLPITLHPPTSPPEVDLLDSESSYLPVFPSDRSSSAHTTRDPDSQDTDFYVTSLLSSLDSAYGYSSLTEKSRLLSSLVGTGEVGGAGHTLQLAGSGPTGANAGDWSRPPVSDPTQAAVKIQAAYRGHACREKYKRYWREVKAATLIQASW